MKKALLILLLISFATLGSRVSQAQFVVDSTVPSTLSGAEAIRTGINNFLSSSAVQSLANASSTDPLKIALCDWINGQVAALQNAVNQIETERQALCPTLGLMGLVCTVPDLFMEGLTWGGWESNIETVNRATELSNMTSQLNTAIASLNLTAASMCS